MPSLNLQLNSEVFFSSIDLYNGQNPSLMTPANTWKLHVLAGFTTSASFATQDIEYSQTSSAPKRSLERFHVGLDNVEWGLKTYIRPTGATIGAIENTGAPNTSLTGNVKPVADWFLWQSLLSNTAPAVGDEQSVWQDYGVLQASNVVAKGSSHASRSNFAIPSESYLYMKLDNLVYQISKAVVNKAVLDAGIEEIATVAWSGMGTEMQELIDTTRDNAISVFGGVLNNGSAISANSSTDFVTTQAFHPFNTMNVGGTDSTNTFIKNRLSAIEFTHTYPGDVTPTNYMLSVTSLNFTYNNNISYLQANEIAKVNKPKKAITGIREVSSTATTYLRAGDAETARLFNSITENVGISSENSSATLHVGGLTEPYISIELSNVHFKFPNISSDNFMELNISFSAIDDSITITSSNAVADDIIKLITEQGFLVITEDSYEIELT